MLLKSCMKVLNLHIRVMTMQLRADGLLEFAAAQQYVVSLPSSNLSFMVPFPKSVMPFAGRPPDFVPHLVGSEHHSI